MAGYIGRGQPVVSNGAERKFKYTATAGQTTFSATYSIGNVHVYRTGVRLTDGVDYTATNGSTVTLTTGCNAGDDVVIVSTSGFQVADAYTKSESDSTYLAKGSSINLHSTSASGNSFTHYSNLDKNWYVGVRGDTSDVFAISDESAIRMSIDTAGRVTMPYQPMFRARSNYLTHTAVNGKVAYDYVQDNVGNHYNGSTSTFTVPVDGVYYFTAHALVNPASSYIFMSIHVNGLQSGSISHTPNGNITSYIDLQCNEIRKLYAGDTVYVDARCYGSGTIHTSTSFNHFSGYLLG